MATSGSWNYLLTAANVIDVALENLGVLPPGGTVVTAHQTLCLRRLNMIAKQLQGMNDFAPGLKIHTRQRVTLMLAKGQQTYTVGPASGDSRASTAIGRTTVLTNYTSGTSLPVTAVTDTTTYPGTTISMTSGDFIGVQLNDGTIGWTTLNGTPGSSPATLAGGLASAANAGNYVWWFTSRAQRIPLVESAVLRNSSYQDTPLGIYTDARQYGLGVVDKYADGQPTSILVEPLTLNTRITLNSQPTDVTSQIVLTGLYPAEDYDATTDDIAFPQEWLLPLAWALAKDVHSVFGQPWTQTMQDNYASSLAIARNLNPENSVAYFQVGGL